MASQVKPTPMPSKREKRAARKSGLRRTRLRQVSAKKHGWNSLYHAAVKARVEAMRAERGSLYCERCRFVTEFLEPHHPLGQHGRKILTFYLLGNNFSDCGCHAWVENHKRAARAEGWIKYK